MKNMSRRSFLGNTSKVAVGTALATSALGAVSVGTASSASASVTSASARRVVSSASSRRGAPYVYGAAGPWRFDCSGLTLGAWKAAGVSINRTSQAQFRNGRAVSRSDLQPGDLVFYYSGISHVALYVGNGTIIHAARPGTNVKYAKVDSMPIAGARRPA